MDYEFQAPKYVNFASAMDEDDEDVSGYFDIEHEHSFQNRSLRCTPQVVLPKGVRRYSSASKQNTSSSNKSARKSDRSAGISQQTPEAIEKNPSHTATPSSTRRLTRNSLTGICPLPATPEARSNQAVTPGVKRTRQSRGKSPESTPSKKLKSTPGIVIKALADIQLSPTPGFDVNTLIHQAFQTLEHISNSTRKQAKSPHSRRVSKVDGIDVELKPDKEHTMETRRDKQQRNPPLHLRSRSVPKSNVRGPQQASPAKTKPEMRSRIRARSVSKDRTVTVEKQKTETERYVSLAEALGKLQTKTPPRFRIKRNSPSKLKNGPLKPMRATVPQSPAFQSRLRNRTAAFLSKEQEGAEAKLTTRPMENGLPANVLKPHNAITVDKKSTTVPQPFKLSESKKKRSSASSNPFSFTARPTRKSPESKARTPAKPTTPYKKLVTAIVNQDGELQVKQKELGHFGVGVVPKKQATEVKPFSFDVREQERLARKTARLQEKIQAEIKGQPKFQANPLPVFKTPPRLKRSPSPFSRKQTSAVNGVDSKTATEKTAKESAVPAVKAPLGPAAFRARQPTVLNKKPFEPLKPQRQLPLPAVVLNSDLRAKERLEYEKKQAEKEAELKVIAQRQKEEHDRKEREIMGKLRKELVHKARPLPEVKLFEPQPSEKPLTDPKTPICLKRSVLAAR